MWWHHLRIDFAEYCDQGITWTVDYYHAHLQVLDLKRLLTRQRRKNGPLKESLFHMLALEYNWEGREGSLFARLLSPSGRKSEQSLDENDRLTQIGALDHLQRDLLSRVHPTSIQTLRIPAHRLKTYQREQDRSVMTRTSSRPTRKHPKSKNVEKKDFDQKREDGVRPLTSSKGRITYEHFTHLRRLEVCSMTMNSIDWETLELVLSSLQRRIITGGPGESFGVLREFSVECQGFHGPESRLNSILKMLNELEVLELRAADPSVHDEIMLDHDHWSPCLKAIRIGRYRFTEEGEGLSRLGRFRHLEELRISLRERNAFQWIVDAKARQQQQLTMVRFTMKWKRTSTCDRVSCALTLTPIHARKPHPFHRSVSMTTVFSTCDDSVYQQVSPLIP